MIDKETKLKLESTLNQIYSNNNLYDGPFITFAFYNVNYIFLNGVYLYPHDLVKIMIDNECMAFSIDFTLIEVTYDDIDNFVINVRDDEHV